MNRKLNYMNLADELAARLHLSQGETEAFLRTFFDTVEQGLAADQQVKVKGLGTFKLNEMGARGSIDVNTGERITIQGYNKITFTPETALKDRINKPFAHFETTELADDYEPSPQELKQEPSQEPDTVSEPESVQESIPTQEPVPTQDPAPVQELEPIPESTPVPSQEDERPSQEPSPATPTAPIAEEPATPTAEEQVATAASTAEEPATPAAPIAEEPATSETFIAEKPAATAPAGSPAGSAPAAPAAHRRKAWCYWLPIVLLVLLACGLYIYTLAGNKTRTTRSARQDANAIKVETIDFDDAPDTLAAAPIDTLTAPATPVTSEVASEVQADAVPASDAASSVAEAPASQASTVPAESPAGSSAAATTAPATATAPTNTTAPVSAKVAGTALPIVPALAARSIKDITAADTCDYVIAGTLTSHELQDGETITRLALRYYGDKRLWPYIVKYNWMKDYDNVHPGIIVNIPNLKIKE